MSLSAPPPPPDCLSVLPVDSGLTVTCTFKPRSQFSHLDKSCPPAAAPDKRFLVLGCQPDPWRPSGTIRPPHPRTLALPCTASSVAIRLRLVTGSPAPVEIAAHNRYPPNQSCELVLYTKAKANTHVRSPKNPAAGKEIQ